VPDATGPPPEKETTAPAGTEAAADSDQVWEQTHPTTSASGSPASPRRIRRDEWLDLDDWRDARRWEPLPGSEWCALKDWVPGKSDTVDDLMNRAKWKRDRAALHCQLYMPTILKLAIDGELRAYVPFIPAWCRTLPDELLFYLAAGNPLSEKQVYQLYELEAATEKFQALKRIARRDDGDAHE
jgi:hypothetical protein